MSAVSSASPDLYQWLQNLASPNSSASTATTPSTIATASADPTDPDGTSTQGAAGSGHHHHHGHQISSQLQSAITSALSADGGKSDPNQVVEDTIKNFLAAGHPSADGSTSNPNDPNATPSATASDSSAAQSSFDAVLQSYGINADQFKQDLHAAVQGGNGSVDFAQVFQSLPVGSTVDTTA